MTETNPIEARVDAFIQRWHDADGSELANYQLFLTELIALLDLPPPDPAGAEHADNAYVFERGVVFHHADGSTSIGRIDLYRRGCLVCEAKQSGLTVQSTAWDDAMLRAHGQASNYARALPAEEGRPPFLLVVDVGHTSSSTPSSPAPAAPTSRFPTRGATASFSTTCAAPRSASACAPSGSTRCRSTRRAAGRASPATSPASSPSWPSRSKQAGHPAIPSPASSCAACSRCSPRTSACCPSAASAAC